MSVKRVRTLRVMVITLLVLLAFQFELGMAVNIANPPTIPPFGFSLVGVSDALYQAGGTAVFHAGLGCCLVIASMISLIRALRSRIKSVQVFGALAFLATLLSATTGLLFVLSGFQNNGDTHGMATNFILAFAFYFLELYFLKPASKTQEP